MRRWLLLVMVLLLPLRAWVGDAMAGQMLQQGFLPAAHAAAQPEGWAATSGHHPQAAAMPHHGCDEPLAAAVEPAAAGQDEAAADDCPTCASCQACSAVALTPPAPRLAAADFSQAPPCAGVVAIASAEQPHAFKPPRG